MSVFAELRKRHVLEIALVYLGVAWLFIEITQFVVANYGFSSKVLDAVFLIAALGFPAFIVIAWYHGEKGPQKVQRGELSLLLTLAVLGAIGSYRIATGEEREIANTTGSTARPESSDATLAAAPDTDLGRRSVAVLPFRNNVSDPQLAWLGSGLADLLTTNFAQLPELRVVGRQSLYDLLTEEGRTETEEIPEGLANTVARAAGAHLMVWGTVTGTADDLAIDAQLIELEHGTVVVAERVRGSDVFAMVDSLTARLTERLGGERTGRQPRIAISELGTRDMDALAAFQAGVQAERAGRPEEAADFYERAAAIDTTFALPVIRLAGASEQWQVHSPPADFDPADVEDVARLGEIGVAIGMDLTDVDWADLDPETRTRIENEIASAEQRQARRESEVHRQRALRMLERAGTDLKSKLQGMTVEDFILQFDSTLGRALSSVKVIVRDTTSDSLP